VYKPLALNRKNVDFQLFEAPITLNWFCRKPHTDISPEYHSIWVRYDKVDGLGENPKWICILGVLFPFSCFCILCHAHISTTRPILINQSSKSVVLHTDVPFGSLYNPLFIVNQTSKNWNSGTWIWHSTVQLYRIVNLFARRQHLFDIKTDCHRYEFSVVPCSLVPVPISPKV